MPELPEVETVVNTLKTKVLNYKIIDVICSAQKVLKNCTFTEFQKSVIGTTIDDIKRYGKHIVFILSNDKVIISHLRMEGKYYFENASDEFNQRHVLMRFILNDKKELRYHDTRRFGTFHLFDKKEYLKKDPINKLGPEPFDKECTKTYLQSKLLKNKAIKTLLLDQTILSGLGNIYVDEVLFRAKIHPETKGKNLKLEHFEKIRIESINVLTKAISLGGTTISSFTSSHGISGKFQNELKVHTRKNQKCFSCKTIIEKIKVNGRGTYFCPKCQKIIGD